MTVNKHSQKELHMPEMNFSPLTKVELDNAIDVILMLYEWDIEAKKKEYHINSLITILKIWISSRTQLNLGPLSAEDFGPAL
jgi:hypothetical protein